MVYTLQIWMNYYKQRQKDDTNRLIDNGINNFTYVTVAAAVTKSESNTKTIFESNIKTKSEFNN